MTKKLYPAGIYLLKVNNRNTRTRCEICSKLTIKTPERRSKLTIKTPERRFIVSFEHISHLVLVFLLLTLNMQLPAGLIKEKTTSKTIIKKYVKIESTCLVPLSNLKYGVVLPPLITHDSGFFIKIYIQFLNSLPRPNFLTRTSKRMTNRIKTFFYIYCH